MSFIISSFCHFYSCCLFCHPDYILLLQYIFFFITTSLLLVSRHLSRHKIPPGVITRKLLSNLSWPNHHPLRSSNHRRRGPWCHRLTRIRSFFARSRCAKSMATLKLNRHQRWHRKRLWWKFVIVDDNRSVDVAPQRWWRPHVIHQQSPYSSPYTYGFWPLKLSSHHCIGNRS